MPIDEELAALIDGELGDSDRSALLARIAADSALRERYETLRRQRADVEAGFDALLGQAPVARLRAMIPPAAPARKPRFGGFALRELAAGLVIGLALAAGLMALLRPKEDWREAVVDYMSLYTNETFVGIPSDPQARALELGAVGGQVGATLTPESVALPGLDLKTAFILAYDRKPLAEVVQIDPGGAPVLFCVIANGKPDAPARSERRDGFSLVSWQRGGKGYLVIAGLPEPQVAGYAKELEARF